MIKDVRTVKVMDELINNEMITNIVNMVYDKLLRTEQDVCNPSQKSIVKILMNTRLTNTTIARVVKEILPNASPTRESVRSLINHIKNQDGIMENFLEDLRSEIDGTN